MTSSSIVSSVVVASNPRTSRALRTSGTRQLDVVLERRVADVAERSAVGPWILRQIASASSRTVVDAAVERLKSSLIAAGDSIARRMPWARSPP